MPEILKRLELNRFDYYETHISLINCLLPKSRKITPMAITVLATFMCLEGTLAQYRFSTPSKKSVREQLNLSDSGLSNYIRELKRIKMLLEQQDGTLMIWSILIPQHDIQDYKFKLVNKN